MPKQFNKLVFVGHLGSDPEMRYTPSGKAVTTFSVATNHQYTNDKGETVKITTWYRCSAWGKQAEAYNQYLKKGSKVLVESRLDPDPATGGPRLWADQAGKAHASFECTVRELYFLDAKNGTGGADDAEPASEEAPY